MKKTKSTVFIGLFIALEIVLTRFVQIPITMFGTFTDRINLGFLPVAISGSLFGIWGGAAVAGLADLIRAIILPQGGAFNPLFTVNAALRGTIYGACLKIKTNIVNCIIASLLVYVICDNLLLDAIISFSYGNPFIAVFWQRLPISSVNLFVHIIGLIAVAIPIERKLDYVR